MYFKSFIKRVISFPRLTSIVYAKVSLQNDSESLKDKVALITGGGSGFGLAIAKRFVQCGANVIITGRNESKLKMSVDEINSTKVKYFVWDLCDTNLAKTKMDKITQLFGGIDIAVNNAGVWTPKKWNEISEIEWDNVVDTNLKGLFFICQAEGEAMSSDSNNIRKIINITSIEGIRGGFGPYFASKWGANGLTKGMAKVLIEKNIVVNAIAPGMGITDINSNLPKDGNLSLPDNLNGRFVAVEEVAELARFLASDSANSIVGQVITIDGGMLL